MRYLLSISLVALLPWAGYAKQPHDVFMIADDLNDMPLQPDGKALVPTPHIDHDWEYVFGPLYEVPVWSADEANGSRGYTGGRLFGKPWRHVHARFRSLYRGPSGDGISVPTSGSQATDPAPFQMGDWNRYLRFYGDRHQVWVNNRVISDKQLLGASRSREIGICMEVS